MKKSSHGFSCSSFLSWLYSWLSFFIIAILQFISLGQSTFTLFGYTLTPQQIRWLSAILFFCLLYHHRHNIKRQIENLIQWIKHIKD